MVGPERWRAIAAAALRDRVPAYLLEDAIGAGCLRLAELNAAGVVFDKPSHAGAIAHNAGVDFVRATLGRQGQKQASQENPHATERSLADWSQSMDDRMRLAELRERLEPRAHYSDRRRRFILRRKKVFIMLAAGFTPLEIAAELDVSESRVSQMICDLRNLVA